ncbi:MAG: LuxR C-terminal-related transcriptional regulator, partial [Actinomycetota bacterium]
RLAELQALLPERPTPSKPEAKATELTEREREILALLPLDLTTREVGEELYLARNTVKTYLRRIYRKLDAATREDAVAKGRVRGLIP